MSDRQPSADPGPAAVRTRIERLYAVPLADFTADRNALVKELRAAGDRETAAVVKALRKPTRTAWAVNQLVHHYPEEWSAVVESSRAVRAAHASGPDGLAGAIARRRAALTRAVETAEGILRRSGGSPGPATARRISGSLEALASGTVAAAPGRLVADLEPPGFGGLAGIELAAVHRLSTRSETPVRPGPAGAKSRSSGPASRREVSGGGSADAPAQDSAAMDPARERAERAVARATAVLEEALAASVQSREEHDVAMRQTKDATVATESAQAAADAARTRLLEAKSALAGLERRSKKSAKNLAAAEQAEAAARAALDKARVALESA